MTKYKTSNHQHELGEGIIWDHHYGLFLFVDILAKKLFRMKPDSFEIVDDYKFDEFVCWVQLTNNSNYYLLGMKSGLAILDIRTSELSYINNKIPNKPSQRLNDSFVDQIGRIWYGTMEHGPSDDFMSVLANYSSNMAKPIIVDDGYGITNGPIINQDQTVLYHTDSQRGIVYKFTLQPKEPILIEKEVFLQFNPTVAVPDGMCFDKDGNIYIAIWGGGSVNKYSEFGELMYSFKLPVINVTNVCYGGESLDRLFVTSAHNNDSMNHLLNNKNGNVFEIIDHNSQGVIMNEFVL
jgi:xylono-1,5-lactonase